MKKFRLKLVVQSVDDESQVSTKSEFLSGTFYKADEVINPVSDFLEDAVGATLDDDLMSEDIEVPDFNLPEYEAIQRDDAPTQAEEPKPFVLESVQEVEPVSVGGLEDVEFEGDEFSDDEEDDDSAFEDESSFENSAEFDDEFDDEDEEGHNFNF